VVILELKKPFNRISVMLLVNQLMMLMTEENQISIAIDISAWHLNITSRPAQTLGNDVSNLPN